MGKGAERTDEVGLLNDNRIEYPLGIAGQLHICTYISCGSRHKNLCKLKPCHILSWRGEVNTKLHLQLRSYWLLGEGELVSIFPICQWCSGEKPHLRVCRQYKLDSSGRWGWTQNWVEMGDNWRGNDGSKRNWRRRQIWVKHATSSSERTNKINTAGSNRNNTC